VTLLLVAIGFVLFSLAVKYFNVFESVPAVHSREKAQEVGRIAA
jgi:hypothetical protein